MSSRAGSKSTDPRWVLWTLVFDSCSDHPARVRRFWSVTRAHSRTYILSWQGEILCCDWSITVTDQVIFWVWNQTIPDQFWSGTPNLIWNTWPYQIKFVLSRRGWILFSDWFKSETEILILNFFMNNWSGTRRFLIRHLALFDVTIQVNVKVTSNFFPLISLRSFSFFLFLLIFWEDLLDAKWKLTWQS